MEISGRGGGQGRLEQEGLQQAGGETQLRVVGSNSGLQPSPQAPDGSLLEPPDPLQEVIQGVEDEDGDSVVKEWYKSSAFSGHRYRSVRLSRYKL